MAEIPELVSRGVERFGERCALRCADGEMTYAALEVRVSQAAAALRARGFAPGSRIVTWLEPGPEHIVLILACFRAGICVCPLNLRNPVDQIDERCAELDASACITEAEIGEVRCIHPAELFSGEAAPYEALRLGSSNHAVALYTSGSTGQPKPAVLSYGNLFYNAVNSNHNIDAGPGTAWLLSLPLYHVGGLGIVVRCLLDGGTIAVPDAGEPLADAIGRYDVTHVSLVATQLRRLLHEEVSLDRLQCVLLGGGPAPESLIAQALERGLSVHTTYGLTEMASQVCTTAPGDDAARLESSGKPLDPHTVRISATGEIEVRGDCLFQGYLVDGEVDRPVDDEGYFATGDLGHFDDTKYLHVTGRRDNLFISGGENIQPEEIEATVLGMPGVERTVVVPVEHAEWGKRPVAFVEWGESMSTEDEVLATLRKTLAPYKVPDRILAWPEEADQGLKVSRARFAEIASDRVGEA